MGSIMLDSWTQNFLSPQLSQSAAPLVVIQQLNHYFGEGSLRKQILFDINLTIYPGEIVVVTGSSESEKNTLLTLVGALQSIQAGSLKIFGQELKEASAVTRTLIRRKIGFIFQEHNLLPFMTTLQNVQTTLKLKTYPNPQIARHRAEAVLTKVGLGGYLDTYPENLAGGQKQRVAIARAFANQPSLVLADEPTASLESQIGREIGLMMQRLAKEQHSAVLLVTHDDRLIDIADRVLRLEEGRLIHDDTAKLPASFTALNMAISDQAVLDWAVRDQAILNGTAPFRTLPAQLSTAPDLEATRPAVAPDATTQDLEAAEKFVPHPLVADKIPLFFSKLSPNAPVENAPVETTDLRSLPPSPVPEQPRVPIAQPVVPIVPIAQPTSQPAPSVNLPVAASPPLVPSPVPQLVPPLVPPSVPPPVPSASFALPSLSQQTVSKIYTIACIDDSAAILYTMQSFLDDELFSVVLIQDPEQAIAEVVEHRPDVIILDIVMPKLDGYEICSLIRQSKQLSQTPIILISEDPKAFNPKRAKALGVTVYLKKPFNQADLIVRIFPHLT
jgi:putative ABC transport system ATP-binding protein